MRKNPELTEQTRQNLIDAFLELYSERDIQQITVREITERAGYNRSTFYIYFSNVEDVLTYIISRLLEQVQNVCEKHTTMNQKQSIEEAFEEKTLKEYLSFFEENNKYLSVMFAKMQMPLFAKEFWKFIQPHQSHYMQMLEGDQRKEVEYIAEYNMAAITCVVAKWYRQGKDIPLEQLINLIKGIVHNSVAYMETLVH